MRNGSLTRLLLPKISRTFHGIAKRRDPQHLNPGEPIGVSKWKAALEEELEVKFPKDRQNACIYRVPVNIREVQPNAYTPNIISIGPYHHGEERLKEMEELKWEFFHRLFRLEPPNGIELDPVMKAMEDLEQDARRCYWDKAEKHSKDKFVRMMLFDGCFIVELFRELKRNNFHHARSVKRWMLPTLRRDLIMLENQLPLFVLQKLFELTRRSDESTTSLEDLALCFFHPLLQKESNFDVRSVNAQGFEKRQHFIDLFRLSILPRYLPGAEETGKTSEYCSKAAKHTTEEGIKTSKTRNSSNGAKNIAREGITGEGTDMMRSMTELMEAGVVIEKAINCPPLDVRSEERWLKIPPLYIDDYKGTLFRNMVAYEQCHPECKPYVTSYLFFFDGLINSAPDVELLRHKGVLHHSLGNNKEVAKLVNGLCKEIASDGRDSYLQKVVSDVNSYYDSSYARIRARLVHYYFRSWVVGISTFGALLVLYLTLIQTGFGFIGDHKNLEKPFHHYLMHCLILPVYHLFTFKKEDTDSKPESQDASKIRHWMFSV
ncbi:UPF0481 protein At3g47200-like [Durio zibethinus]|uniref:UPF0481 protein At3g47200-like n=1 Tax=Durio zibethinus TaxID=66656 RepID=A0A6P5XDS7_DURZI|nr:UPF0481 protein At3g47200-like [Durio zibethinus]